MVAASGDDGSPVSDMVFLVFATLVRVVEAVEKGRRRGQPADRASAPSRSD